MSRDTVRSLIDFYAPRRPLEIVEAPGCLIASVEGRAYIHRAGGAVERHPDLDSAFAAIGVDAEEALLRRVYGAWNLNDMDLVFRLLSPRLEWRPTFGSAFVGSTVYHGYEGLMRYRHELGETFEDYHVEALECEGLGEQRVVHTLAGGRGRGSGAMIEQRTFHFWRLQDGEPVYMCAYESVEDARAAATAPAR